jgi:glycerate 2-kinase
LSHISACAIFFVTVPDTPPVGAVPFGENGAAEVGRAAAVPVHVFGDSIEGEACIVGAILTPDTLDRAWAAGIRPRDALADNDGHGFFGALGDAVVTGPTLTNINDFRAAIIQ